MPVTESLLLERTRPSALTIEVIDTIDRFGAVRAEWTDLLRQSGPFNPFLTWEWLHAWWTHLGASRPLLIATVRENGCLVGAAPWFESRGRWPWVSQLEFLGTGWAGSDYLDVVARRDHEGECVAALAGWLRSRGQTVRLDHLRPGALAAALGGRLIEAGWAFEAAPSGVCPFAPLAGHSWESYLDTLRPSQRTRCRRYLNTLQKKFDVRFEHVEAESQRSEVLSALMAFHEARWTPRGGSTAFQTPALRAFHHDISARALDSNWLRLFALRLNDEISAVTYCFHVDRRFYLYQHGFSPRFWPYSVGVVALGLTIRFALEEGAEDFDMLYGEEPYKALWATETRQLERLELFPPHMRGRLHHHTVDAERGIRMLARRIFPRKPCDSNVPPAGVGS